MSADEQSGAGRREVAYRVFAAEYDDADFQYTENEADDRAPNYVVTPTGARVNRLFVVGVLTEVERVNDEMLRGRIVDPTGAFVVYAGQYQPDALTALERLDPPAFVAVTGKARTFQPEDAETIYTSVRPESINEVDADTRDRWTVGTARHTLDRIAAFAGGIEREERGEELTTALEAEGVDHGLAAGIALAIDHYDTTPAYLDAVRKASVEAVKVVAAEREEVTPVDLAPDASGDANVDLTMDESLVAVGDSSAATADSSTVDSSPVTTEETSDTGVTGETGATTSGTVGSEAISGSGGPEDDLEETVSTIDEPSVSTDESDVVTDESDGVVDEPEFISDEPDVTTDESDVTTDESDAMAEEPSMATDEMYEFDEDEREEIESEFGTDFSTGAEVDEPGESDLDAPDLGGDELLEGTEPPGETGMAESETEDKLDGTEEPDVEPTEKPEPEVETTGEPDRTEEPAADVDLEDAVVGAMRDLDSGDGADRDAVIETVSDDHGADPEEVEDAIQDALMSGTCYEPGDGLLKAI